MGEANWLMVNPSSHGSTTPTLFYFNRSMLFAVPETTANATAIRKSPVFFACEHNRLQDWIGSFAFNTTDFYSYNKNPQTHHYAFTPLVCTIESDWRLSCCEKICHNTVLVASTKLMQNGYMALWNGYGRKQGRYDPSARKATYYVVPACEM